MAFLKRSKSHKGKEVKEVAPPVPPPPPQPERQPEAEPPTEQEDIEAKKERRKSRFERRKSIFGRSKSASEARKSVAIERPRTANRAVPESTRELSSPLALVGETIEIRAGGDTFSFPTPSPRLPPPPGRASTFQACPSPLVGGRSRPQSPAPPIGVAVGSPSQPPPAWGRSYTADEINGRMGRQAPVNRLQQAIPIPEDRVAEDGAMHPVPELRKKKSGWKTLGALFGRKGGNGSKRAEVPAEPFYKVQIPEQRQQQYGAAPAAQGRVHYPHAPPVAQPLVETPSPSPGMMGRSLVGSISSHHSRSPSLTRGLARFEARAEADRQSFMPNIDSKMTQPYSHGANRLSIGTLSPPHRTLEPIRDSTDLFKAQPILQAEQQETRHDSPTSASSTFNTSAPGATPRTPRLDLDIPGGDMERYSVMFEKLLEPRQSILERRQSKAKRQRIVMKKDLPAIPTSASSCGPSPIEVKSADLPTRLVPQRSVTSPHLNRAPSLTISVVAEKRSWNLKPHAQELEQPATAIHRPRPIQRSKTAPPGSISPVAPNFSRPKPPTFASSEEALAPDSPLLGEECLPPTPTTIGTTPRDDGVAVPSHAPLPIARRRRRNDSVDEQSWDMLTSKPAEMLSANNSPRAQDQHAQAQYPRIKSPADLERQIVQVSVARQVSVNKARRHVQKAVESKQPLKPRVVEMGGKGQRKSTVVLIEGGDD